MLPENQFCITTEITMKNWFYYSYTLCCKYEKCPNKSKTKRILSF